MEDTQRSTATLDLSDDEQVCGEKGKQNALERGRTGDTRVLRISLM